MGRIHFDEGYLTDALQALTQAHRAFVNAGHAETRVAREVGTCVVEAK